jgi:hypothetical protein
MTNIRGVLARVFVSDLDAALPLYSELAGTTEIRRFGFRDVELAQVGPFLLLAGDTAAYRDRTATVLVESLTPVLTALESVGAEVVEGPSPGPNGARLIARHPDGAVFEYIETGRRPQEALGAACTIHLTGLGPRTRPVTPDKTYDITHLVKPQIGILPIGAYYLHTAIAVDCTISRDQGSIIGPALF